MTDLNFSFSEITSQTLTATKAIFSIFLCLLAAALLFGRRRNATGKN